MNCKLYSNGSKDFLLITEGVDGDINVRAYQTDENGKEIQLYVTKKRRKPFPPEIKKVNYRFCAGIGGGDVLINLLFKEIMRRCRFIQSRAAGSTCPEDVENEKNRSKAILAAIRNN